MSTNLTNPESASAYKKVLKQNKTKSPKKKKKKGKFERLYRKKKIPKKALNYSIAFPPSHQVYVIGVS